MEQMKFDPLKDNFSLPKAEEKILEFWNKQDVFTAYNEAAKDRPQFVFYEGPPTANGRPGIHHVISRTVKDLVCRYKAMQGFRVDRKAGWDTHGLPVEIEVEKQLKLDNRAKVIEYGIDKFNQKCRESVFKYLEDWRKITRRTGYWLDLDDAYVTLTNDYIESVWWILKNFYDRDLIYKGFKIIPFCPRCGTGLSSHEVAQGYAMIKDPSVYVKVQAADGDFSYLVWTTTPWTLPSNAALCLKADADYVTVEHEGEKLVLAEALVPKLFTEPPKIVARAKGESFLKRKYIPLFDTYKDQSDKAFYVITGDFVTLNDGTGIVHIAPGFGADDYEIGKKYDLPVLQAVEPNGHFKDIAGPYKGMFIKDADPVIIKDLKIAGRLFKKEQYEHNYPFCWRCDSPLIYIARESWYIKTTAFREQLLKNNNAINWVPDEIRTGRMLNWLENNVDWALSRERFWGTPLPIWICTDKACAKQRAVGSLEQLRAEGINVPSDLDLHKPYIDAVELRCDCGGTMKRVPELIDVWFDSGAMPYAQWHYPFENKEVFESKFPADFISEAVDQTRGWFYSLLAISTMLFDKPAFKNVVVIEFILDKEGKKMSKHKGNVVDPFITVDTYGADPVRWYLVSVSNPSLPTRFDLNGLAEVVRKFFDTLRNTYSFFALYANIDDVVDKADKNSQTVEEYLAGKAGESEEFDNWIISKYQSLVRNVTADFDKYEITRPVRAIQYFVIEDMSNWYVRNNRRRFWAAGDDPSKMRAYHTLYSILEGVCRLIAPVAPFISELLWQELVRKTRTLKSPLSVHMTRFTKHNVLRAELGEFKLTFGEATLTYTQKPTETESSSINEELESAMDLVQKIVSLGRAARSRKNLKVRQPLSRLLIGGQRKNVFETLAPFLHIIKDELNIKEIAEADLDNYVTYSAKLNFKTAGPKLGAQVKAVAAHIVQLDNSAVAKFAQSGSLNVDLKSGLLTLTGEDVEIIRTEKEGLAVEVDGPLAVAIDTVLTEDLLDEGFAREMVSKIQNLRKTSGFDVTDQITIKVAVSPRLKTAVTKHEDFIRRETLADKMEFTDNGSFASPTSGESTEWNINGEKAAIAVARV